MEATKAGEKFTERVRRLNLTRPVSVCLFFSFFFFVPFTRRWNIKDLNGAANAFADVHWDLLAVGSDRIAIVPKDADANILGSRLTLIHWSLLEQFAARTEILSLGTLAINALPSIDEGGSRRGPRIVFLMTVKDCSGSTRLELLADGEGCD